MINGVDLEGDACKSVEVLMSEYLEKNKGHVTYVDFKYIPSTISNMKYATLVVESKI